MWIIKRTKTDNTACVGSAYLLPDRFKFKSERNAKAWLKAMGKRLPAGYLYEAVEDVDGLASVPTKILF